MKRLVALLVVVVVLTVSQSAQGAGPLEDLLQFLYYSAIKTDELQTRQWIRGTPDKPIEVNGNKVWEGNSNIAGSPEAAQNMFEWERNLCEALARSDDPLATVALAAMTAIRLGHVRHNNEVSPRHYNIPPRWALSYRWYFD
jgi:hypothetical protein